MDRDLLEVTVPQLEQLYRSHKYTVTQVVRWYIARIEKYNGIYRAVQNLDAPRSHRHRRPRGCGSKSRWLWICAWRSMGRPDCCQGKHQYPGNDNYRWMERLHDSWP